MEYEAEEDEKITSALMRKELTAAIKDLKTSKSPDAKADLKRHQEAFEQLKETEEALKNLKRKLEKCQFDLEVKLGLKKFGPEEETWDARRLKEQAEKELTALEADPEQDKEKKAKAKRLRGDIATLERRIEAIERLSDSIGGVITEPEAKELILRKHHDLVAEQLNRYLNAEKRALLAAFGSLWEKHAVSLKKIEHKRAEIMSTLAMFMRGLGYE
jgi:type I restriction enzyme M protein